MGRKMMSLSELEWWEHKHMEIEKVCFSLAFRSLLKSLRMSVIHAVAFHAPYKHHCHPASFTTFSLLSISELSQQRFILLLLLLLLLLFFLKFCSRNPHGRNCLINKLHLCKKKKDPFSLTEFANLHNFYMFCWHLNSLGEQQARCHHPSATG